MFQKILASAGKWHKRQVAAAAICGAKRKGETLLSDGYEFRATAPGVFGVVEPGQNHASFTVRLFAGERLLPHYRCDCDFFKSHSMCEHGHGLVSFLTWAMPLVHAADNAPPLPALTMEQRRFVEAAGRVSRAGISLKDFFVKAKTNVTPQFHELRLGDTYSDGEYSTGYDPLGHRN